MNALIIVKDQGRPMVAIYRDSWGELTGHDLLTFLDGRVITGDAQAWRKHGHRRTAHTMGDLAAQLVHHFKRDEPLGEVYLCPIDEATFEAAQCVYELSTPISDDQAWAGPAFDLLLAVYREGELVFNGQISEFGKIGITERQLTLEIGEEAKQ